MSTSWQSVALYWNDSVCKCLLAADWGIYLSNYFGKPDSSCFIRERNLVSLVRFALFLLASFSVCSLLFGKNELKILLIWPELSCLHQLKSGTPWKWWKWVDYQLSSRNLELSYCLNSVRALSKVRTTKYLAEYAQAIIFDDVLIPLNRSDIFDSFQPLRISLSFL